MKKGRREAIVGVGATGALGADALSTVLFARAAKSSPRAFELGTAPRQHVGTMRSVRLGDELTGLDRMLALAAPALIEAAKPAWDGDAPLRVFLSIPSPTVWEPNAQGSVRTEEFLSKLAQQTRLPIDVASSQIVAIGHAGFAVALDRALHAQGPGCVVAGGVDTHHEEFRLAQLLENMRLKSETVHGGFVPGEGAAFLALERATSEQPAYALVRHVASGLCEEPTFEEPRVAELATLLVRQAAASLRERPVGWMLNDANGERSRSKEVDFLRLRCSDLFPADRSQELRLADEFGDLGAATGAMYAAYVALGMRHGFAPSSNAIITLASAGRERGVIALEAS